MSALLIALLGLTVLLVIIWSVPAFTGWRTIISNALMAIQPSLLTLQQFAMIPEFAAVIPADLMGFYALGMAAANFWLRKITTTPLGVR